MEKTSLLKKDVDLGEHQKRVQRKLKNSDALLLYHGLGSGKTLSSIAATQGGSTDVVVPAALRPNYRKEVKKFTTGKSPRNVMSYEKATKSGLTGGDSLVLDEVQRLNNPGSARTQAIINAAPSYKKRILLSGTPIKNHPQELAPLLRILSPKDKRVPADDRGFRERFIQEKKIRPGIISMLRGLTPGVVESPKNLHLLSDVIKGKVDYHAPAKEGYPSRTDSVEEVPMSPEQVSIYNYVTSATHPLIASKVRANMPLSKQEQQSLNSFMTGARIVSNTPGPYGGKGGSPKMRLAAKHLVERAKASPNFKALAYSNYLDGGVKEYAKHLDEAKVPYRIFSGELSDSKKKEAVDAYNKGKAKVLLISGAGAEGLDLKGTRLVQILEPHWNKSRVEQAIGRARRFKSHEHLPEEERHVEVKHYRSVHPQKWYHRYLGIKKPTSADQYLSELAEKKEKLNESFLDVLRQEGSKAAQEKEMNNFWNGFEKRAEDQKKPGWWARQKGAVRAMSDKNLGGVVGIANSELVGDRVKRGLGHGAVGAAAGAGLGALAGLIKKNPAAGAAIGTLLGAYAGNTHGLYTADRDYLAKKGIKLKWLGIDNEFSPEAEQKYIK